MFIDSIGLFLNGSICAMVFDTAGKLYAGGDFDIWKKDSIIHNIAVWNGSSWNALGKGTDGEVRTLVFDKSGNLYAGGKFDTAGSTKVNHIALWRDNTWMPLGIGTDDSVIALALDSSKNLYAGGTFKTAGGTEAKYIAKWDGADWSALGSGLNSSCFCVAYDKQSGYLYAGGIFDTAGGLRANHIARWNGSKWDSLGSGVGGGISTSYSDNSIITYSTYISSAGDNRVASLCISPEGILYAGGNFLSAGGSNNIKGVAQWDGAAWNAIGGLTGSRTIYGGGSTVAFNTYIIYDYFCVFSLTLDKNNFLYAGGLFNDHNISVLNGHTWYNLGEGTDYAIKAIAFYDTSSLYAGGSFNYAGTKLSKNIAKCNVPQITSVKKDNIQKYKTAPAYNSRSGLINFNLQTQAQVSYKIFSLSGRLLFQASENMGTGSHSLKINTSRIARGMYILHFKAGKESMRFKLAVEK